MVDVLSRVDIENSLKRVSDVHQAILANDSFISNHGVHSTLQALVTQRFNNWIDACVHEHILEHAIKAERIAMGGLRSFFEIFHNKEPVHQHSDICVYMPPSMKDVEQLVEQKIPLRHQSLKNIINDSLQLAGMNGRVIVEKSITQDHVEQTTGYLFRFKPATTVLNARYIRPFVACADALLEEPQQITTLLEELLESGETCFLFLRGISESVKACISKNALSLIPVIVPIEYDSINGLVDVAVIAGCDVLSIAKGELLSSLSLSNMKQIDKIDVRQDNIGLFNASTTQSVLEHQKRLLARQNDPSEHELMSKYFNDRIRSLTANAVYIRLSDDSLYVERAQIIDDCLRSVHSMIAYGVENGQLGIAAHVGRIMALRCRSSIDSIGAAVKIND